MNLLVFCIAELPRVTPLFKDTDSDDFQDGYRMGAEEQLELMREKLNKAIDDRDDADAYATECSDKLETAIQQRDEALGELDREQRWSLFFETERDDYYLRLHDLGHSHQELQYQITKLQSQLAEAIQQKDEWYQIMESMRLSEHNALNNVEYLKDKVATLKAELANLKEQLDKATNQEYNKIGSEGLECE